MGLHRVQGLLPDRLAKEAEDPTQCKGIKTMGATVMEVLRGAHCRLREEMRFDLQSSMIPELKELKELEEMIIWNRKNHGEPPNQMDRPSEQHLQISLTGRRRRFALDPPWEAWFAESSQCFHRRRECRGLRKANRVRGHPICGICQQSARGHSGLGVMDFIYEDQVGNFHTDTRCRAVTGAMLEIRQCKLCKENGLS